MEPHTVRQSIVSIGSIRMVEAVPYRTFEAKVHKLYNAARQDVCLVYTGGEWEVRLGDPNGWSESVSESALGAVLDCLDN